MSVLRSFRQVLQAKSDRPNPKWWTNGGTRPIPSQLESTDCIVTSYPRSGNTWVRLLIADVVLQHLGHKTKTVLPIHEDKLIPDLDRGDVSENSSTKSEPLIRMFKSHYVYSSSSNRFIWVIRRPASSLVSYYHFFRRYPDLESHANEGVDCFCEEFAGDWKRHTEMYRRLHLTKPNLILPVFFEQLLKTPVEELSRIFEFLGIETGRSMLETAVENHRLDRQSKVESNVDSDTENNGERFFRNGNVDDAKSELSPEVYKNLQQSLFPIYREQARRCGCESIVSV